MAAIPLGAGRSLGQLNAFPSRYTVSALRTSLSSRPNRFSLPLLTSSLLPAFQLKLPPVLSGLWESILRAVPKKKTSHRKKRQRFLVGKALKDVTALNKCPGCGNTKRAHLLCPYCVQEIKDMWRGRIQPKEKTATTKAAAAAEAKT